MVAALLGFSVKLGHMPLGGALGGGALWCSAPRMSPGPTAPVLLLDFAAQNTTARLATKLRKSQDLSGFVIARPSGRGNPGFAREPRSLIAGRYWIASFLAMTKPVA